MPRIARYALQLLILSGVLPQALAMSELNRLALAISNAAQPVKADFAVTAIHETAAAFAEEAARARYEARDARKRDTARWAQAVDTYADGLWAVVDTVTDLTPISIRISADQSVELNVDGTTVVVSGPKPRLQSTFEQQIIERFCMRNRCEDLVAEFQPPPGGTAPDSPLTRWSFSAGAGPVCSSGEGLEFQFRDMEDLPQKRQACERVVMELESLASQLARSKASGMRIDWNHLVIVALRDTQEHRVELNTDGDSLLIAVPALAASERLFLLIRPWLAAQVSDAPIRQVVINADALLKPVSMLP